MLRAVSGPAGVFPRFGPSSLYVGSPRIWSGQVAAIMMEPARSEKPPAGYLEEIKALAKKEGAVLIFDEVSCGWRMALGGMQEFLGVTPDVTVVAKAMSNGYPMGAVVGARSVMEPAARMFISSSYWSDNIGLIASLTTIRELRRRWRGMTKGTWPWLTWPTSGCVRRHATGPTRCSS